MMRFRYGLMTAKYSLIDRGFFSIVIHFIFKVIVAPKIPPFTDSSVYNNLQRGSWYFWLFYFQLFHFLFLVQNDFLYFYISYIFPLIFSITMHIFDTFWFTIILGFKKTHNVLFSTTHCFLWVLCKCWFATVFFVVISFSSNLSISPINMLVILKYFSNSIGLFWRENLLATLKRMSRMIYLYILLNKMFKFLKKKKKFFKKKLNKK